MLLKSTRHEDAFLETYLSPAPSCMITFWLEGRAATVLQHKGLENPVLNPVHLFCCLAGFC